MLIVAYSRLIKVNLTCNERKVRYMSNLWGRAQQNTAVNIFCSFVFSNLTIVRNDSLFLRCSSRWSGVLGTIYHFFQDLILGVPNLFHNAVGMVVVESNDSRLVSNVYKFGDYVTSRAYEGGELARSFFLGSFTDKNPSLVGKYHDVAAKLSEAGADIPSIGQPVDTKENRHKFNLFSSSGLRGFAKTHEPSLLESLGK